MDRKTAIKTAAEWWTAKVCGNDPDTGFVKDKMDAQAVPVLNLLFGNTNGVSSVQRAIFQDVLEEEIAKKIDSYGYADLLMDYHPCPILEKAIEEADIDEFRIPFKTMVQIRPAGPNKYTVKAGRYGGELEDVPPCA